MDFEEACTEAKALKRLNKEQKLKLYSLYKQATEGDCCTNRPGLFEIEGRAKWNAWQSVKGTSKEDAKKLYIDVVKSFLSEGDNNASSSDSQDQDQDSGQVFSRIKQDKIDRKDMSTYETAVYLIKEGKTNDFKQLHPSIDYTEHDENGNTLLHWAADSNQQELLDFILSNASDKVSLITKNSNGETPLHLAVTCEHYDISRFMITKCRDLSLEWNQTDSDGNDIISLIDDVNIKTEFKGLLNK
ncbi:hypothetical protein MP638_004979 [Amoeboaphelidium occidentale]|nr:hypothetical protein MP638_004979 [Amoeboaphelidium occidentale]